MDSVAFSVNIHVRFLADLITFVMIFIFHANRKTMAIPDEGQKNVEKREQEETKKMKILPET